MTIDELMTELSRIDDQVRNMVAPLSDAQGNWRPEGGRGWSVTQNLQHLAKTNVLYTDCMRAGLRRTGTTRPAGNVDLRSIPGRWGRWFIGVMEPPPRFRVKTRPIVQPAPALPVQQALAEFVGSQDAVRAFAREVSEQDLGATFRSPFGPLRFRIGTGLLVLAAHDRRHVWQARQVTLAEGFPRA
ncbi:MAG TPA: DinB family protein [Vicinamibacterales bacterium]|nr:DinB family protein [Vicinamibacterales bacterium]